MSQLPFCLHIDSAALQIIEHALLEIFGCDGDGLLSKRCFGIISDMELVNVLAARQLGAKYPWLINLNCAAHAISNACKVHSGHPLGIIGWMLLHAGLASDCSCILYECLLSVSVQDMGVIFKKEVQEVMEAVHDIVACARKKDIKRAQSWAWMPPRLPRPSGLQSCPRCRARRAFMALSC